MCACACLCACVFAYVCIISYVCHLERGFDMFTLMTCIVLTHCSVVIGNVQLVIRLEKLQKSGRSCVVTGVHRVHIVEEENRRMTIRRRASVFL